MTHTPYLCPYCRGDGEAAESCTQPCDEEKVYWEEKRWREERDER